MAVLIIEAECKSDTEHPIHVAYNRSITRKRIIAKREIKCTEDEYNLNGQCCKKCKPGEYDNFSRQPLKVETTTCTTAFC